MIPWANPRANYLAHGFSIDAAIANVLDSNSYILGKQVQAFEREFAEYIGVKHAIGVSSGLDALILAMQSLSIGPGDEVITVAMTAPATIQAIQAVGATPIVVDVAASTIDVDKALNAITKKTKAIIPVHLYGRSCDLGPLLDSDIPVIEDCAQAAGGYWVTSRLGSLGRLGCFSFYPTKNLGALGDGGMVTTNDSGLAAKIAYNRLSHRLDELQAAILRVKLPYLDDENKRRRAIAKRYNRAFGLPDYIEHVYHLYVINSDRREEFRLFLSAKNVSTGIHYAVPAMDCDLPVTNEMCRTVLSLPMYPELADHDIEHVINCVTAWNSTGD